MKCPLFHRRFRAPVFALSLFLLAAAVSCSWNNEVEEYFRDHGLRYPADVSGVSLFSVKYAGIEREELLAEGAREFVEAGVMSVKEHFLGSGGNIFIPGTEAVVVEKPVLYRSEGQDVGLMVKVTGYGEGEPRKDMTLPVERIGGDFWKVENYAYFNRGGLYRWEFGGWVF